VVVLHLIRRVLVHRHTAIEAVEIAAMNTAAGVLDYPGAAMRGAQRTIY
jgi:hypothetical protein